MVDLVKIRKKAKKEKEKEGAPEPAPVPSTAGILPAPVPPGRLEAGGTRTEQPSDSATQQPTSTKLEKFKEEAGKRREAHATQVSEAHGDQLELLTFMIADEQYAVDIERIVEIVTPRPVTRIPNADSSVVGIMSLRGTIVTLVDVRGRLHHPRAPQADSDTRIVVIDSGTDFGSEMVGFVVDRVLRVVKIPAASVGAHPVVHATELVESILGVFLAGGALTILLDLDKLLASRALAAPTA